MLLIPGMKLEAVNINQTSHICVATVKETTDHLLWIDLESIDRFIQLNVKKDLWDWLVVI